jgi:hypothetical protein
MKGIVVRGDSEKISAVEYPRESASFSFSIFWIDGGPVDGVLSHDTLFPPE